MTEVISENISTEVEFDKKEHRRKQLREAQKRFYEAHKQLCNERVKPAKKAYAERNREKINEKAREYYQRNKEKINEKARLKKLKKLEESQKPTAEMENQDCPVEKKMV